MFMNVSIDISTEYCRAIVTFPVAFSIHAKGSENIFILYKDIHDYCLETCKVVSISIKQDVNKIVHRDFG